MMLLESILISYLCSDAVHIGIGVELDLLPVGIGVYVDVLAVTSYMLVVEFGGKDIFSGKVVRESDVDVPGRKMPTD
jgi:hypothetical protein